MGRIITYLKESRAELMKVVWPSRKQARDHSLVVIAVSLGVALVLGIFDFLLEEGILKFIIR